MFYEDSTELLQILAREMSYNFSFPKQNMLLGRAHCNSLFSNVYFQAMFALKNISGFYNFNFFKKT